MAYQPLARKFRPNKFEDLVGQDAVTLALSNAIRLRREPNNVIFSGVRGVGKTTLARLYAKALNCENGPTPEPCNICSSCNAINLGTHEDVLEIDGASNTSVDDVRQLRETVGYVTQRSAYKVYIIDEVHMLSQSAFNALLKTLEEPPSHVVFIFATTDLHKVPQTIISRCPTFYLQKIPIATIAARLAFILDKEAISYESAALNMISREARGSLRDALTLLDQVIALGDGSVTAATIGQMLRSVSSDQILSLVEAVLKKEASSIVSIIDNMDQHGARFSDIVEQIAGYCRHGFMLAGLGQDVSALALADLDQEELERLKKIVALDNDLSLHRLFRTFMKCRKDLDGSDLDRFVLENYALEWCFDPGFPQIGSLIQGKHSELKSPSSFEGAQKAAEKTIASPLKRDLKAAFSGAIAAKKDEQHLNTPPPSEALPGKEKVSPRKEMSAQTLAKDSERVKPKPLPQSWRELVELLKELKPLQARIFEETYDIVFTTTHIAIVVDETSLAGKQLLDPMQQSRVAQVLADEFGFSGKFEVKRRSDLGGTTSPDAPSQQETHQDEVAAEEPETIIDARRREQKLADEEYIRTIKDSPITKRVLAEFNGTIDKVELTP